MLNLGKKHRKSEPLSKSAIRNQMQLNKVKKSKRERSSRRGERDNERDSSRLVFYNFSSLQYLQKKR